MALVQLIYLSTAAVEFSDEELDRILESSVRHNATQGLTGMLLYVGGCFMQVLEGEEAALDETYRRICKDPRHFNITTVSREPIETREFATWAMGFRRVNSTDAFDLPGFEPIPSLGRIRSLAESQDGLAKAALLQFAQKNY